MEKTESKKNPTTFFGATITTILIVLAMGTCRSIGRTAAKMDAKEKERLQQQEDARHNQPPPLRWNETRMKPG